MVGFILTVFYTNMVTCNLYIFIDKEKIKCLAAKGVYTLHIKEVYILVSIFKGIVKFKSV